MHKSRPLNPAQLEQLDQQLADWQEAGVIEPAQSPWGAAMVPVRKKEDPKARWTCDYRDLNACTVSDAFPLPDITNNLQQLSGSSVFSTLDSAGAFHAIPVEEESRDVTAFVCPRGQFRYRRMPFGVKNGPATYSRLIETAVQKLPPGFTLSYLDDLIIYSPDYASHLHHLKQVLRLHVELGLKLKLRKCHIAKREVQYLGHQVSSAGISMVKEYIERILAWPSPRTPADLRSFLGVAGYYRAFIPRYAELAAPLDGIKNKRTLEWSEDHEQQFQQLKEAFVSAPIRHFPDYSKGAGRFVLDTDWSASAKAAVLYQEGPEPERELRFIGAAAAKCSQAESNYPSSKGELAALVMGLRKFEHLLLFKKFLVRTDNSALTFLHRMKLNRGVYSRWYELIANFDFDITHRPGKQNVFADALSRMTNHPEDEDRAQDDREQDLLDIYNVYHDLCNAVEDDEEEEEEFSCHQVSADLPSRWPITWDEIAAATADDATLRLVREYVVDKARAPTKQELKSLSLDARPYLSYFDQLRWENGVLTINKACSTFSGPRICMPLSLRKRVFEAAHGDLPSGHFGVVNTLSKMKAKTYWPGMHGDVQAWITNCQACLQKLRTPFKKQELHKELLGRPGVKVYIDTVGPLSSATYKGEKVKHILTIQDGYTRYLTAVPIADITAKTITHALLENYLYVYGMPESLHSDRRTAFTSELFSGLMKALNIQHTVTPPYHPESNRVERVHRTLGAVLRAEGTAALGNWPALLGPAVMAINTTTSRATGRTPYELQFGRAAVVPLDIIVPAASTTNRHKTAYPDEHITLLKERAAAVYEEVMQRQNGVARRRGQGDTADKVDPIEVGDRVHIFSAREAGQPAAKLRPHWVGPYRVLKKIPPSLFEVCPCGGWTENEDKVTVVTRDRMKKWMRTPGPDEVGGDDDLRDGEEEVDVVEVPVLPGGADEEGDQLGGGPVYPPPTTERAPPLQEDGDRPEEDDEAEPAGGELEHVFARPDDPPGDGGEEVGERYPDQIDEPDSELDRGATPRPAWDELLPRGEGGGDTAPELDTPEAVTMEPSTVSRPSDELYEPHPAGGREPDLPPAPPGPARPLELEGPPVTRRRLGVNEAYALGPAAAPGGGRREEHPGQGGQ